MLFKGKGESVQNLFIKCQFSLLVWDTAKTLTGGRGSWTRGTVEKAIDKWREDKWLSTQCYELFFFGPFR